jgi:hypothetical protein
MLQALGGARHEPSYFLAHTTARALLPREPGPGAQPRFTCLGRDSPRGPVTVGVPGIDGCGEPSGCDVVDVAGDADLRREPGRGEQSLDVGVDRDHRVGDGGGFQFGLGQPGCCCGLLPESGVGQQAGAALSVMHDRDFEERGIVRVAEKQLGEQREKGDVADHGLGDASANVADDERVAELELQNIGRVDAVVEAADDEQLLGWLA